MSASGTRREQRGATVHSGATVYSGVTNRGVTDCCRSTLIIVKVCGTNRVSKVSARATTRCTRKRSSLLCRFEPTGGGALVNVLGIRFCSVSPDAKDLATFLAALGLPQQELEGDAPGDGRFPGAIFPAGTEGDSWVEVWQDGPSMPTGVMLQVVVDDADAFAAHARANGLEPAGPMDAHGERVYFLQGPGGLHVTFQSKLNGQHS